MLLYNLKFRCDIQCKNPKIKNDTRVLKVSTRYIFRYIRSNLRYHRKAWLSWVVHCSLPAIAILLLFAGCSQKAVIRPQIPPTPSQKALEPKLFTIQVGAFSRLKNAIQLTETLERKGLTAYYFRHEGGLYKVRFGDFPSKEAAGAAAQDLVSAGTIDSYFIVGPDDYVSAKARVHGPTGLRNQIVKTAKSYIGLPYRLGGSSPQEGFDCSGLAMAVYQLNGLNLPRSSKEQYASGDPVERRELLKGDLVFFKIAWGRKVSHVGVYVGDGKFIHAPGKDKAIRLSPLSNTYYTQRYAGGRSYIR